MLVRGAVAGASRLGISRLAIGLTVVAFGTSAPEMFVSVVSSLQGRASLSLGNVLGSNIINIALVLGLLALWLPIHAQQQLKRFDIPCMLVSYGVLLAVVQFPRGTTSLPGITRPEGILLIALLILYLVIAYRTRRDKSDTHDAHTVPEIRSSSAGMIAWGVLAGILLLGIGSELVVSAAVWFTGNVLMLSERSAGILILAFATSLPELVTSLAALRKGETDISLGNIIGSNIFNSLGVLGLAATVRPLSGIEPGFPADIIMMFAVSLLLWFFLSLRRGLSKSGGLIMLVLLAGYVYRWLL
ncbi:calcium/sodium antiporter [Spirochaeta africana]|nr:calcium/sodium antiporter [Spirochaeta africana]